MTARQEHLVRRRGPFFCALAAALGATLLMPRLVVPPASADDAPAPVPAAPEVFAVEYDINRFTYTVSGESAHCANRLDQADTGPNICTFRQALAQANALPDDQSVLITLDETALDAWLLTGPAYPAIDFSDVPQDGGMCVTDCQGVDDDGTRALYRISHPGTTVDFRGRLGIVTKNDGPNASTIYIDGSGITVRNLNGLTSGESVIVVAPSATNILIENIVADPDAGTLTSVPDWTQGWPLWTWTGPHVTERFLVIRGDTAGHARDITLRHLLVGGLYGAYGGADSGGGTVWGYDIMVEGGTNGARTVNGLTVEDLTTSLDRYGDNFGLAGWRQVTLKNAVVTGSTFRGGRGSTLPITLAGAGMTVDTLTIKDSVFDGQAGNHVINFKHAAVSDVTIDNCQFRNGTLGEAAIRISGSGTTINRLTVSKSTFDHFTAPAILDFRDAKVTTVTIDGSTFTHSTGNMVATVNFTTATATDVTVKNSVFEDLGRDGTEGILDFASAKIDGLTVFNNRFTKVTANNDKGGVICFHTALVNHITVEQNTVDQALTKAGAVTFREGTHVVTAVGGSKGPLKVAGNTFQNVTATYAIVTFWHMVTESKNNIAVWFEVSGNEFLGNTVTEAHGDDSDYNAHLILPGNGYGTDSDWDHTSKVDGNVFQVDAQGQNPPQVAILWYTNRGLYTGDPDYPQGRVLASHLEITNNSFDGFQGGSILLGSAGGVLVRGNTFGPNSARAPEGSFPYYGAEKQSTAKKGYLLNNFAGAGITSNRGVLPLQPASEADGVTFDAYGCSLSFAFAPDPARPTPVNYPYDVDLYAGERGAPQQWLNKDKYQLQVTEPDSAGTVYRITLPVSAVFADDEPDDIVKYVRTQVVYHIPVRLADGTHVTLFESSQYGGAYKLGKKSDYTCLEPDFSLTKTAYSDSGHTTVLSPGSALSAGDRIYWTYTVANLATGGPDLPVVVRDDRKEAADGGPVVCTLAVPAGGTASCDWDQVVA